MNKEQQQIIDEAYELYWNSRPDAEKTFQYEGHNIETRRMTKDEFVEMVKTDEEYGIRWGLKIVERQLSLEERKKIYESDYTDGIEIYNDYWLESKLTTRNIPTKLITVTRELSLEERVTIFNEKKEKGEIVVPELKSVGDIYSWTNKLLDSIIPTNKTIESYI